MSGRPTARGLTTALTLAMCAISQPGSADPPRVRRHLQPVGASGEQLTVMLPGNVPLVLVQIPAGAFRMGSPENQRGRYADEAPHQVTLTRGYYLGKYEVTQRQWEAVMGSNPSYFSQCGPDCPVEQVSWNDVCGGPAGDSCVPESFIGKVNQLLGTAAFRLPTEAEWERAARGGTSTEFSFPAPSDWDPECGYFPEADLTMWWCGNSGDRTNPVGQKEPNAYGLYDMHGNVWEWVADWYGAYPSEPQTDPTGPTSGTVREYRGGGWTNPAKQCRSSNRGDTSPPDERKNTFGFRLARSS